MNSVASTAFGSSASAVFSSANGKMKQELRFICDSEASSSSSSSNTNGGHHKERWSVPTVHVNSHQLGDYRSSPHYTVKGPSSILPPPLILTSHTTFSLTTTPQKATFQVAPLHELANTHIHNHNATYPEEEYIFNRFEFHRLVQTVSNKIKPGFLWPLHVTEHVQENVEMVLKRAFEGMYIFTHAKICCEKDSRNVVESRDFRNGLAVRSLTGDYAGWDDMIDGILAWDDTTTEEEFLSGDEDDMTWGTWNEK
ncbi:MAG: hypothetical protein M1834_000994 [Cirrosporium novae-zelandiae]|nr:MAG: hypothetical protein M1834_000994 [Cirrosporium novae-zelandiae]